MNKKVSFDKVDFLNHYPIVIKELHEIRKNVIMLHDFILSKELKPNPDLKTEIEIVDWDVFENLVNFSKTYAKKYEISKKEYNIKPFSLDGILTSQNNIKQTKNDLDFIMECVNAVFVDIMKNWKKQNYYKNFEEKTKLDA